MPGSMIAIVTTLGGYGRPKKSLVSVPLAPGLIDREKYFPDDSPSPVPLTPREAEILQLLGAGAIARQIAQQLGVSLG
jgi:DNA-binding NarL/FixJ family response regulator